MKQKLLIVTLLPFVLSAAAFAQQFRLPDWERAVESGFKVAAESGFIVAISGEPMFNCANNLDMLRSWRPSNPGFINVCPSLLGCNRAFFYREAQARCNLPQYPRAELDAVCDYPEFPDGFAERIASPPRGQRMTTAFLGDFGRRVSPSDFSADGPFRRFRIDAANEIWGLDETPETWLQIGRGMIAAIVEALDRDFCEIEDGRGRKAKALKPAWDAAMEIARRSGLGPYWVPGETGQAPPTNPPPLGSPPKRSLALLGPFSFGPSSSTPRIRHHAVADRLRDASAFEIAGSVALGNLDGLDSECKSRRGCLLPLGWATGARNVTGDIDDGGWQRWRSDLRAQYSLRIKPDKDAGVKPGPGKRPARWLYRLELKTGNPVRRQIGKAFRQIVPGKSFSYVLAYGGGRVTFEVEHSGLKRSVGIFPAIALNEFPKREYFALVFGSEDERFGPEVRFPAGSRINAIVSLP